MTFTIVNQWPVTAINQYGLQIASIANSEGNALVAILGLGSNSQSVLPRFNVADDARNFWTPVGTRFDKTATRNRRIDVWVAPNASPASIVSLAESWYTNGVQGVILEVSGFPTYAQVDFIAKAGGTGTSAVCNSTATTADFVVGGLMLGETNATLPVSVTPPGAVTALTVLNPAQAAGDMTCLQLNPAWGTATAGAISDTFSWTGSFPFEAILVGFKQVPTAPSQPNAKWPSLQVQAAFGTQPGDVSAYPVWTDITTRVTDDEGASTIKAARGRDYELTQPEAGSLNITLDNHDGAFLPTNTLSPYFPNVLPECPVQVLATWNGKTRPVGTGSASKWPQNFADPQYGQTNFESVDGIGQASQVKLTSAYAGDVLTDSPYAYFRLGENYTPANGLPFNNSSRTNIKPAYGVDDNVRPNGVALTTGQIMNLAGDASTGVGTTATAQNGSGGPGVLYRDNNLPSLDAGFTIEFWAAIPHITGNEVVTLVRVIGPPSNYANPGGTRLWVVAENGASFNFDVIIEDFQGNQTSIVAPTALSDANLHHYVVTAVNNGGTWTLSAYIDAGNTYQNTVSNSIAGSNLAVSGIEIGPVLTGGGNADLAPYTIGQVAAYPYVLDTTRILQHYSTGHGAAAFGNIRSRVARLFTWSGAGLDMAATANSPSPLLGPADSIEGQSLADAAFDLTVDEGGMFYCDGFGNNWYATRTSLYNQVPKFTFSDRTQPGWMSDAPNISSCVAVDAATTSAFFNTPNSFASGGNPTTDPRATGFLSATPILNYTAFAQFKADVTNSPFTQNSVVYTPAGPINKSIYQWIRYDIEGGGTWPTPIEEKQDPQTFLANFISLAHANGFKVMVTPGRDLSATDTVHPQLAGETADQWYLRTNIPAASANADILSVQSQSQQGQADEFYHFFNTARTQALAANLNVHVWAGISVTFGNGANMYSSARLAAIADGIWINIIGNTTDSIDFMKRVLASPLATPFDTADFNFDDTFIYNTVSSQRTISTSTQSIQGGGGKFATAQFNQYGADAIESDFPSQAQYMPRGPLEQGIETTSDQDAYDRANWSLTKYKQPVIRASKVTLTPSANPASWAVALAVEQGDIVQVDRRPVGSPEITVLCIVQKVEHDIGPLRWQVTLTLTPYFPENAVIQLDNVPYNTLGTGALGW